MKERFQHKIVDQFPPPNLQPHQQGSGVTSVIRADRAAGPSSSAEEHVGKPKSRGPQTNARGEHVASDNCGHSKAHPEPIPTQMDMEAPTNGLLTPGPIT